MTSVNIFSVKMERNYAFPFWSNNNYRQKQSGGDLQKEKVDPENNFIL